jgi:hypothetical protein
LTLIVTGTPASVPGSAFRNCGIDGIGLRERFFRPMGDHRIDGRIDRIEAVDGG